jgi:bifunctional UDP-N-acetylglucosamine pyrophosphorylase/glucosamine-1-phosphate N-acetyltransferase
MENSMRIEAVILAAGLGTRMKSSIPKVLHLLGGQPLILWSVAACRKALDCDPIVVVGPDSEAVSTLIGQGGRFVEQEERLGTGHALQQTAPLLQNETDIVLVTYADMPLIRAESFARLAETQRNHAGPITLLTGIATDSRGFGRVQRDEEGRIIGIIEEAHATAEQRTITELNLGAYAFRAEWLWGSLDKLPLSPKGEYYLTDMIALAVEQGLDVASIQIEDESELIGINTRVHLAEAETILRTQITQRWMMEGVTMLDPATTYIGPKVEIGQDTILLPNTILEGETRIGERCRIGPNTVIRETSIGDQCQIQGSVLEGATLEEDVTVGPFAHLRRGAYLCRGVHIGNFGEVKNSRLESGVKLGHFSYIGDAHIGAETNVGAGTITCNFDGEKKHHTEIGEGAFIGSDTMLVAPLKIGDHARTGAGSVVTKDVPDHGLAVGVPARVIRKLDQGD